MRINRSARLAACAAFAGSAALAVVIPGASAFAAKGPSVTCTSVTGSASTQSLSGCSGAGGSLTGTSGTESVSASTITWATGGVSHTSVSNKVLTGTKDKCTPPPGDTNAAEVKIKGKVLSGTLAGSKIKGTICAFGSPSGTVVKNLTPFTV